MLQQVGIVRVNRQNRVSTLHMFHQRIRQPRGIFAERVVGRMLEAHELHLLVAVDGFHQRRAGLIRGFRDFPDERRRFGRGAAAGQRPDNHHTLAGLQVERDFHRQLGIDLQPAIEVVGHPVIVIHQHYPVAETQRRRELYVLCVLRDGNFDLYKSEKARRPAT